MVASIGAAREITNNPVNIIGLCACGILSSMVSAHLSATGQLDQVASLCLGVTLLDMTEAGTTVSFMDETAAKVSILASRARGYMDGRTLAEVFAWLRPDDLIWNYWVNNYLRWKPPPPFDILYWNADTTKMPAGLHRNFIEIAMANALSQARRRQHARLPGGSVHDRRRQLPRGRRRGPHLALAVGLPRHPATRQQQHPVRAVQQRTSPPWSTRHPIRRPPSGLRPVSGPSTATWLAQAETVQGSWWSDYTAADRSGEMKDAPRKLGSAKLPPLEPAPGTYVLER